MIEPGHPTLSIVKQCDWVKISQSFCNEGTGQNGFNLELMRLIDEQSIERRRTTTLARWRSTFGARRTASAESRYTVWGLQAVYLRPRASKPHPDHRAYPYLLRGLSICRPNQVWCAGITYIPLQRGYLYLVAIMGWSSREVLPRQLSNTLDASFCVEALDEALEPYGPPEIMNTTQASQFTSLKFTETLKEADVRISMDGKGCWMYNISIERLCRTLKYECVYLNELETGSQARDEIGRWASLYSDERPPSSLDERTPTEA